MRAAYCLVIVLFLLPAFVTALDLSEYPAPFVVNGVYDPSNVFVVGADGPASDSIAVADISTGLQFESWVYNEYGTKQYAEITPVTKLDTEIAGSESSYNLIIVSTVQEYCCQSGGHPCADTIELFGVTCNSWTLKSGEALIKLVKNGNKAAMIVAGTTNDDTRRAAKVLLNHEDYAFSGTELLVRGTTINEAIIDDMDSCEEGLSGSANCDYQRNAVVQSYNTCPGHGTVSKIVTQCSDSQTCSEDVAGFGPTCVDKITIALGSKFQAKAGSMIFFEINSKTYEIKPKRLGLDNLGNPSLSYELLGEDHGTTFNEIFVGYPDEHDLDGDGVKDVRISLENLDKSNNVAEMVVEDLAKEPSEPAAVAATTEKEQPLKRDYMTYWVYSGSFFGLFMLGLILFKYKPYKKLRSDRSKRQAEEEHVEEVVEERKARIPSDLEEAVRVSGFTVEYKGKRVLNDVSFKIKRGEFVCLIGESGAGKSTIIESLVGRKKPSSGSIAVFGKVVGKDAGVNDYLGFVPQSPEIYLNRSVEDNLKSSGVKYGIKNAKVDDVLSKVHLSHRKDLLASKLSGGQKKLLSLAMELVRDPELLVLDEPTTGLDPSTRNEIITILCSIASHHNKTVLITTHFMDDAEEADDIVIIGDGKVLAQGSPEKLKKRLPSVGKIVNIVLDNVTEDLLKKIEKIEGVKKIIREGRSLKIITDNPNAVRLGEKIDQIGGVVNKTEIISASMKEVFVYFTGQEPE